METVPPVNTPVWLDKSFWLVVLGGLFLLINKFTGLNLDAVEITGLVLPLVTYIVMNKWKTTRLTAALVTKADALKVLTGK